MGTSPTRAPNLSKSASRASLAEKLRGHGAIGEPVDPDVHDDRAGFDELPADEPRAPHGRDKDVPFPRDIGEIRRPGMADRNGGVALEKEERHGFSDDLAPPDDDRPFAGHGNVLAGEQLHDARRRARREDRPTLDQQTDVLRMKRVHVLVRVDRVGSCASAFEMPDGSGDCTRIPSHAADALSVSTRLSTSAALDDSDSL